MKKPVILGAVILTLLSFSVISDDRRHSREYARPQFEKRQVPRYKAVPPRAIKHHPHKAKSGYKHYYKPGYRTAPLPRGFNRVMVNAAEYFFFEGYFYLPSSNSYVIVEAPIGAIVASIPRLHGYSEWRGMPYFVVGDTYYRKHPRGYVVVENPHFGRYR